MQDLNDKITGGTLAAVEWNEIPSEIQNIIEDLGLVLSSGDLNQLGKAIADYAAAGTFYTETGAADAYVATIIGAKQGLHALAAVTDGAIVRFRPGNANTGASTLNVNSLGVKDIVRENNDALISGDLITTRDATVRWDQSADDWRLLDSALGLPPINGTHLIDDGVVATTSGTQHDFTAIPSYVKRITIVFDQVGLSGADDALVQIGDSGGIEATGYESSSFNNTTTSTSTAGFIARIGTARNIRGIMVLARVAANDWVESHTMHIDNDNVLIGGGIKTLSAGPLTQVRLTRDGTDTFDAGQATLFYE